MHYPAILPNDKLILSGRLLKKRPHLAIQPVYLSSHRGRCSLVEDKKKTGGGGKRQKSPALRKRQKNAREEKDDKSQRRLGAEEKE
jgi:hypothetical protein